MTPAELDRFRLVLKASGAELEGALRGRDAIVAETSADVFDQIQHASEMNLTIGNFERVSNQLHEVRTALERLAAGRFGLCLECDEKISLRRLSAVPWTALCLSCRESADRPGQALPVMPHGRMSGEY